ncbi:Wzz/FepE/Etk N-terminal domain-containing protein [Azohydromonas aeria]|uniref:Wzz/FepE/Etk N-terminal domain-containing protein n=1 Tax=Azohydromonas aeria TaxID=2590212 RepID=UPI0012F8CCA9|nr:Wzz/FepE/Etk N-terminal domain-containing protein [Azohydromonas aeria]
MTVSQLVIAVLHRWRTLAAATLAVLLLALAAGLVLPKRYTAMASVLVDLKPVDPVNAGSMDRTQAVTQALMATQTDLIASGRVARRVVESLRLHEDAEWLQRWRDATGAEAGDGREAVPYIADQLLRKLQVKPNRDSNIIAIAYTGPDAAQAAAVANAFANAAIETNLDLKVDPARQFTGWFEQRTATLRRNLELAQERLARYQREHERLGVAGGQLDIESGKLTQLAAQLVQIQTQRVESASRQAQARSDPRNSPDVLSGGLTASLRGSIVTAEAELQNLQTQYGEQHPQVQRARSQLEQLQARLDREMETAVRLVGSSDAVNRQREAEVKAALEAQKAKVLAMTSGNNEMAVLQRDVDSAQRALDAATTRQSQAALESQLQQTNVYLLTPATRPYLPSSPKLLLLAACAAVLGSLLGLGLALWRELRAPRIRSVEELISAVELPLLATLPRAAPGLASRGHRLRLPLRAQRS